MLGMLLVMEVRRSCAGIDGRKGSLVVFAMEVAS